MIRFVGVSVSFLGVKSAMMLSWAHYTVSLFVPIPTLHLDYSSRVARRPIGANRVHDGEGA